MCAHSCQRQLAHRLAVLGTGCALLVLALIIHFVLYGDIDQTATRTMWNNPVVNNLAVE